ncbi:MAG: hypothetical protein KDC98_05600 [Planctomycetes bacterium]|nr:hypothetical protein [Planctomycetota bacterium]
MPTADAAGVPGWLAGRDEPFHGLFERLLATETTRNYTAGFTIAQNVGRPAVPLLWEMLSAETANVVPRTAVLAAAMLAAGPSLDEHLFKWLGQQKAIKEERTMVALAIALGPPRERPVADFWSHGLGPARSPEKILAIAVRLAAARMPGVAAGAAPVVGGEIGLAAASAFAGLPLQSSVIGRLWDLRDIERDDEMFWRGALLAGCRQILDGGQPDATLLQRARQVAELRSGKYPDAREIAVRFRAMAGDVRTEDTRPDLKLLRQMAPDQAAARRVRRWLEAAKQPGDEEPYRLAVSYVLSRDIGDVIAEREDWGGNEVTRQHIAVALAWMILGSRQGPEAGGSGAKGGFADVALPRVPEWQLVRWALGQHAVAERCEDPALTALLELAADDRLPRDVGRRVLEETLWRWGSHPGIGLLEAEQLLVRDLLLVGSNPGGKYRSHVSVEQRYRPKGIDSSAFFEIAVAYYDFVTTRRPPLPFRYRLR